MEKVWEELKKIEAQAEAIRSEAQKSATDIAVQAQQRAETLIVNGKTYAEQDAKTLLSAAVEEANRDRANQLEANKKNADKLRNRAEKRMDQAVQTVVKAVLREENP